MTLVVAALLVPAWAGLTLDGSTGLITAPTAGTVAMGKAQTSVGLQLGRSTTGVSLVGLPAGLSAGLLPGLELGARVERDARFAWPEDAARASAGIYARYALIDRHRGRPALSVQAEMNGLGAIPGGSLGVLSTLSVARSLQLHASVFARIASGHGPDGYSGGGLEARVSGALSATVEGTLAVDSRGVHIWNGRGGLAVRVLDRISVLAWAGGGRDDGRPWVGGGVALQLFSKAPAESDADLDEIPDWTDRCPGTAEDVDGFRDLDGCVDLDNDGDGIVDADDLTPNGEPPPDPRKVHPDDHPRLKMRIKPRPMPGPVDPKRRGGAE